MKSLRERWAALDWRLKATRRLWSFGVTPDMPFMAPGPLGPGAHGQIDDPEAGKRIDGESLYVRGWALFPSGPPAQVEAWLGEQPLGRARVGLRRPDIEKRTGDALAGVSGFELIADLSQRQAPDGEASLRAVATSPQGERHELPPVAIELRSEVEDEAPLPPPAPRTPRASGGRGRRLLVCTHQLNLGGAQLYLLDLLRELVAQGLAEPTVVSALDGKLRADLEGLGIPVHISDLAPLEDLSSHIGRVEELVAWAEGRDFEAVFVNTATAFTFPGAEAAGELGLPAIWAIHESFPLPVLWAELGRSVRRRAERALSEAAVAVFEAEATRRLFEPPLRAGRGLVRPYGLDLEPIEAARAAFDPTAARREAGLAEDAEVVLCVGTIEPRKAQLPLTQAFGSIAERHPRARLVFVGGRDDADTEAVAEFIDAAGLHDRVQIVPVTPDVLPWYQMADLLVCASDIESLPRTVLEAMAFETPVLATNVFGLPELIDDGETGWLCEPRDMRALAAALERALGSSQEERRRIGRAGRELVIHRHALDAYAREVGRLIEQAVAGEAPTGGERAAAD
ncbi:MAG TPA: glycosyltransferase family 4 protein [Solirubrobacterales bacterium]|nr:glycosyltransferase family 4 protein [Solirubrobacterales bacterium]